MTEFQTTRLDTESSLLYCADFLPSSVADQLFRTAIDEFHWEQSQISLFGKRVTIPRLNAWFGDASYRYSGTRFEPHPLPEILNTLKKKIERATGDSYNSALANLYRNGGDCMGWHSDDEKSLGSLPQIASLSVGAKRKFVLREKSDHSNKHEWMLEHGSLLVMRGACQLNWQHALPRMRRVQQQRVNLTFRYREPDPN